MDQIRRNQKHAPININFVKIRDIQQIRGVKSYLLLSAVECNMKSKQDIFASDDFASR